MDLIQDRSQIPTRLTYREIENATAAQAEFLSSMTTTDGSIDFGAGHRPIDSANYQTLTDQGYTVCISLTYFRLSDCITTSRNWTIEFNLVSHCENFQSQNKVVEEYLHPRTESHVERFGIA
jgi:hypothetical protein